MMNVEFKYDSYEKMFGDGYYPQLKGCDACTTSSSHSFKLVWIQISDHTVCFPKVFDTWEEVEKFNQVELKKDLSFVRVWKQLYGDNINGLDGSCGVDLFKLLGESGATGIVNLNLRFIYKVNRNARPPPIEIEKTPTDKAKDTIRYHAAMPYVLGGSVAKYQGSTETIKYLETAHPEVFELVSREEIDEIIRSTIDEERT